MLMANTGRKPGPAAKKHIRRRPRQSSHPFWVFCASLRQFCNWLSNLPSSVAVVRRVDELRTSNSRAKPSKATLWHKLKC
jgi:hypothetical protein